MNQLFFSVPDELFRDRMLPFFRLADLVHLDEATANKELRIKLHEKLFASSFQDCGDLEIEVDSFRWMKQRNIYLRSMTFCREVVECDLKPTKSQFRMTTTLKLRDCVGISDDFLISIAESCTNLITLDLAGCLNITGSGLVALSEHAKRLQCLDISNTVVSACSLLNLFSTSWHELESFSCSSCDFACSACECGTDGAISALSAACPKLHTIDLCSTDITDIAVRAIAQHCSQLLNLNIDNCMSLTNTSLNSLAQHSTRLQTLHLARNEDFTDEAMVEVSTRCTDLQVLCIADCYNISDISLVSLASSCRHLVDLDLQYTALTDNTLNALADFSTQLRNLNISQCNGFTESAIIAVILRCPQLESLDLSFTSNVTSQVLDALGHYCTNLVYLNLCRGEMAVCDHNIIQIVSRNTKMIALNLAHCDQITDVAVSAIATHCAELQYLDLTCCKRITDASLEVLTRHCLHLNSLEVMQCPKITVQAIDKMIEDTFVCVSY